MALRPIVLILTLVAMLVAPFGPAAAVCLCGDAEGACCGTDDGVSRACCTEPAAPEPKPMSCCSTTASPDDGTLAYSGHACRAGETAPSLDEAVSTTPSRVLVSAPAIVETGSLVIAAPPVAPPVADAPAPSPGALPLLTTVRLLI